MDRLFKGVDLTPYFRAAEAHAALSPCTRRQYAAMIAYEDINTDPLWVIETNSRQSRCCDKECIRDQYKFQNGQNVEYGSEVHAETAALIASRNKGAVFILVGFQKGEPLYGEAVFPCHSCALAIRFAGYKFIYVRGDKHTIKAVSIAEIIEHREVEWERVD